MIPKILHVVWVGDENKRPDNCIQTWRTKNPDWELKIWGNAELFGRKWLNCRHMSAMAGRQLNGVADMMRYEIIWSEGGFAIDADSVCVRPLADWLLEASAFTCWENEICRPGFLASGYIAAEPENVLVRHVIEDILGEESVTDRPAWQSTGPQRWTATWRKHRYSDLTIYPSHYFIPHHFAGVEYTGNGPVFAKELWAGTKCLYNTLYQANLTEAHASVTAGKA